MMGTGIAAVFALSGRDVFILDVNRDIAERGVQTALSVVQDLVEHDLVDPVQADGIAARLKASTDPEGVVRQVGLFVEAITENLELKQEYFRRLDAASREAILCSNTSGISITRIAEKCRYPDRILTTHFWMPPHLVPLVEVVPNPKTDPAATQAVMSVLRECGKAPVLVRKDVPGQLGNRIQHAMVRECMHIVAEGIASPEDVDTAIKTGFGIRMPVYGVFEHNDLVGLDLVKTVQDTVLPTLSAAQSASEIHNRKVAAGELGAKTGRGFLEWPPGKADQVRARRDAFLMEFLRWKRKGRVG
jgi:3-hydroxybutyryl-CoA dehydrogenase